MSTPADVTALAVEVLELHYPSITPDPYISMYMDNHIHTPFHYFLSTILVIIFMKIGTRHIALARPRYCSECLVSSFERYRTLPSINKCKHSKHSKVYSVKLFEVFRTLDPCYINAVAMLLFQTSISERHTLHQILISSILNISRSNKRYYVSFPLCGFS